MQPPLFVRPPTDEERMVLAAGPLAAGAGEHDLAAAHDEGVRGERVPATARALGCSGQTARNAIHAFDGRGAAALAPGSHRPRAAALAFDAAGVVCPPRANTYTDPTAYTCGTGFYCLSNAEGTACVKPGGSGSCGVNFCANDTDCVQRGYPVGPKCIKLEDRCNCRNGSCGYDTPNSTGCFIPCDVVAPASVNAADASGPAGESHLGDARI
jgi:hypothetical protein